MLFLLVIQQRLWFRATYCSMEKKNIQTASQKTPLCILLFILSLCHCIYEDIWVLPLYCTGWLCHIRINLPVIFTSTDKAVQVQYSSHRRTHPNLFYSMSNSQHFKLKNDHLGSFPCCWTEVETMQGLKVQRAAFCKLFSIRLSW